MKISKPFIAICIIASGFVSLSIVSCKKDSTTTTTPTLATSALYDTLGWFIQGGTGAVAGNGTKMIADPENSGQTIQAGRLAIRTVVEKALGVIAADTAINEYFPTLLGELGQSPSNTTGYSHLLNTFTDFVQQAVSGQTLYQGLSMKAAHNFSSNSRFGDANHTAADSTDFKVFVNDVAAAATSLNVPNSVIGQLGALLYTTEGDVVQK